MLHSILFSFQAITATRTTGKSLCQFENHEANDWREKSNDDSDNDNMNEVVPIEATNIKLPCREWVKRTTRATKFVYKAPYCLIATHSRRKWYRSTTICICFSHVRSLTHSLIRSSLFMVCNIVGMFQLVLHFAYMRSIETWHTATATATARQANLLMYACIKMTIWQKWETPAPNSDKKNTKTNRHKRIARTHYHCSPLTEISLYWNEIEKEAKEKKAVTLALVGRFDTNRSMRTVSKIR